MNIFFSASNLKKWIETDEGQWVCQLSPNEYWVAQIRPWKDDYCVTFNFIDLETYDEHDIEEVAEYYGYDITKELDSQIIVEMLAEDIYDFQAYFEGTYEECEKWIKERINMK